VWLLTFSGIIFLCLLLFPIFVFWDLLNCCWLVSWGF
jgi:hypothetical protein